MRLNLNCASFNSGSALKQGITPESLKKNEAH
jgi:hypothetical protein